MTNQMNNNMADNTAKPTTEKWRRLAPVAVIFYIGRFLRAFIKDGVVNMMPLAILVLSADSASTMVIYIATALGSLMVLSAIVQYLFFRYRLVGNELLINEGVIKRKHRVINFERIQNINIDQPFYFRPFSLVSLAIETAGAKGDEGNLAGISTVEANHIRDQILQQQNQLKAEQPQTDETTIKDAPNEQLLTQTTTADLVRYGLASNSMFWLAAVIGTFSTQFHKQIENWLTPEQIEFISKLFGDDMLWATLVTFLLLVAGFSMLVLLSIVGAIVKFNGYQLTLSKDTLKRKSGLINSHEESLNLAKIQAIVRRSNFISAWLKRENLICRQTSSGGRQANNFLVPARTAQQCAELITAIAPDSPIDVATAPISRRYIRKTWLLKVCLPILLVSIFILFLSGDLRMLAIWLLAPLCYPLVVKRWRKYRFGLTPEHGLISSGFIGRRQVLFELFKVQRVVIKQSPVQRKHNLATLEIYLASGQLTIPYMPIELARQWFDLIYYRTETSSRPWF